MWTDTVTVYRQTPAGVERQIVENCRKEVKVEGKADILGQGQQESWFLAVPGPFAVQPGDRVVSGIGPEVTGMLSQIPGLVTVTWAQPHYLHGALHHTEARAVDM